MSDFRYKNYVSIFPLKNSWGALCVLLIGLILTFAIVNNTKNSTELIAKQDFEFVCNEIVLKLDTRLHAHSQLLRSGAAFFDASDTVTSAEWKIYTESEKISKNLPGILGIGYSAIIKKNQLKQHIQFFRNNGFPDYTVYPEGNRELYTSIIYLEPFTGRNLRAFGYDMLSEPVRRKAMELSRDSDLATLSGKVLLVQETEEDIQAGCLMYVPVYQYGKRPLSVEERRETIKGWVYSPYRMDDLISGVLGSFDYSEISRLHVAIYDDDRISDESLLYTNHNDFEDVDSGMLNLNLQIPITFNGKTWTMQFKGNNESLHLLKGDTLIILISGIVISILLFFLVIAFIITNLRNKNIESLNNQLERLNKDQNRFISILGHDLKNPVGNIMGLSALLKDNILTLNAAEIEEIVLNINTTAVLTNKLLEDILLWARSQQGKIVFNPQNLNLSEICTYILDILSASATAKNIKINCSPETYIQVYADKDMLKTVILNLVLNAIKFTNTGGAINIDASEVSKMILITVSDNGVGINAKDLKKLFNISEVYTTKGTNGEPGTGLGLLLCKEFIDIHGGKIWVESDYGKGSDFKFTLPLKDQHIKTLNN